jgi:hypothetical protein
MRPAHVDRFPHTADKNRAAVIIEEEVVSDAPLHHSPLKVSTLFYSRPLCPTLRHIIDGFQDLSRGNMHFFKNSLRKFSSAVFCEFTSIGCALFLRQGLPVVV